MQSALKKSFTLIEMVVAVSILSIGIVLILRSFLSSSGALGVVAGRIEALEILEAKMADLKEKAASGALEDTNSSEEAVLDRRKAVYNLRVTGMNPEETDENLKEVRISLDWQEDNKGQNEILATYLQNTKNPQ